MPVTRRACLAAAAAALFPAPTFAAPARRFRFGFSLYGMKSLPLPDALTACAEIGYDAVEFALMPGYPTEPAKLPVADRADLRKRVADLGLTTAGLMENLPALGDDASFRPTVDRLKAAFELAHSLAPDRPAPVETVLGGKPADWDKVKDRLAERTGAWADAAAAAQVVVAVKPHVGNALHTIDGAKWLISTVNSRWLRLAFDASHFEVQGVRPADAAAALAPLSVFAHVKDVRGTPAKFEFLLPGDGTTDYPPLLAALAAAGYAGPVVVEVSAQVFNKPGYDPVAAAKHCFAKLAPAFAAR